MWGMLQRHYIHCCVVMTSAEILRGRSASPRRPRPHSRSRPHSRDKGRPNLSASGLLSAANNTVKNSDRASTFLKYHEPPEARKPFVERRLYVSKGDEQVGASLLPFPAFL
jgi:hypothetical protein